MNLHACLLPNRLPSHMPFSAAPVRRAFDTGFVPGMVADGNATVPDSESEEGSADMEACFTQLVGQRLLHQVTGCDTLLAPGRPCILAGFIIETAVLRARQRQLPWAQRYDSDPCGSPSPCSLMLPC